MSRPPGSGRLLPICRTCASSWRPAALKTAKSVSAQDSPCNWSAADRIGIVREVTTVLAATRSTSKLVTGTTSAPMSAEALFKGRSRRCWRPRFDSAACRAISSASPADLMVIHRPPPNADTCGGMAPPAGGRHEHRGASPSSWHFQDYAGAQAYSRLLAGDGFRGTFAPPHWPSA